jgi:hypothetical protein
LQKAAKWRSRDDASKRKATAVGNPYTNILMLVFVTPTPGFAITAEYEVLSRSEARHQGTLQPT